MARNKKLTMYSFGYYGWGTATHKLVQMMDAAEEARGNIGPFFVDVRIRRTVRAPGFRDHAFEKLVGSDRYLWEPRLGNEAIVTHKGRLKIADPKAAGDLLDIAVACSKKKQPVVFFCACAWPYHEDVLTCHRAKVAELLLKEAGKRGVNLEVVEWPGGEREACDFNVDAETIRKVMRGAWNIPLRGTEWRSFAGLPYGTIVRIHAKTKEELYIVAGPPKWQRARWELPVHAWAEFENDARQLSDEVLDKLGLLPFAYK